jgi:hypothetical protein
VLFARHGTGCLQRRRQLSAEVVPPASACVAQCDPGPAAEASALLQVVLKRCNNVDRALVESKITEFAGRGYRALGLARAKGEGGELSDPLSSGTALHQDSQLSVISASAYPGNVAIS